MYKKILLDKYQVVKAYEELMRTGCPQYQFVLEEQENTMAEEVNKRRCDPSNVEYSLFEVQSGLSNLADQVNTLNTRLMAALVMLDVSGYEETITVENNRYSFNWRRKDEK